MLLIFAGGGVGAVARFLAAEWSVRKCGTHFPVGTLAVNVSGCFLIGLLSAVLFTGDQEPAHAGLREFLMIGVLGGYTTFSTFGLQTLELVENGRIPAAILNSILSLAGCLVAVWMGRILGSLVVPKA
jgi:CrcB protein